MEQQQKYAMMRYRNKKGMMSRTAGNQTSAKYITAMFFFMAAKAASSPPLSIMGLTKHIQAPNIKRLPPHSGTSLED